MKPKNSNKKIRKYTHLNESERFQLEALLKAKQSVKKISEILKRSRSTIYHEIIRGSVMRIQYDLTEKRQYRADVGQRNYESTMRNKQYELKIGKDHQLETYIREKILKNNYSPDAVIGKIKILKLKFTGMICTKTLYNYIDRGIFAGISNNNLWEKRKKRKRKYLKISRRISLKNTLARSIESRPQIVNERTEYGHWEGDCVKGPKGKSTSLLTLTERKSRQEIIIKIELSQQSI